MAVVAQQGPITSPGEIGAAIVAALKDGPLTWREVKPRLPAACSTSSAKLVLGDLQRAGRVISMGEHAWGAKLRLRTPEEEARIPTVRAVALPEDGRIDARVLRGELDRVLSSGASYDLTELVRNIRGRFPMLAAEILQPHLDELVSERRIERIPLGSLTRYRARARRTETA